MLPDVYHDWNKSVSEYFLARLGCIYSITTLLHQTVNAMSFFQEPNLTYLEEIQYTLS